MSEFLKELRRTNPKARVPECVEHFQRLACVVNDEGKTYLRIREEKFSTTLERYLVDAGFTITKENVFGCGDSYWDETGCYMDTKHCGVCGTDQNYDYRKVDWRAK